MQIEAGDWPPQLFCQPGIGSEMCAKDSTSSEDPESDEIESAYLLQRRSIDLERDHDRGDGKETVGESIVMHSVRDVDIVTRVLYSGVMQVENTRRVTQARFQILKLPDT